MEKQQDNTLIKASFPYSPDHDLNYVMDCKDHSVSRETFSLFKDPSNDLMITWPQPGAGKLASYYESEDYISHTDASESMMDRVYQLVKRFALRNKFDLVNKSAASGKGLLLDVGCGTGDFLNVCKNGGWRVMGVEPSDRARALARNKSLDQEEIFESIEDLRANAEERFDVITLWHVLEHLPKLSENIETLRSLLKPKGVLIIAVPNHKSYDANFYGPFWAAYDVPRHLWHFSRKSMRELFERFDMKVEKEFPMLFDAFYVSMLSEKYKNGKSRLAHAFYRGLVSNLEASRTGEYSSIIYLIKSTNKAV